MIVDICKSRRKVLAAGLGMAATAAMPKVFSESPIKGFFATHGLRLGLQLYMLGQAAAADLDATLQRVAHIGYRAIELPALSHGAAPKTRAAADKAGISITSLHLSGGPSMSTGSLSLLDHPADIAREAQILGCKDVVLPLPVMPTLKVERGESILAAIGHAFSKAGADPWKRTAALLNERGEALQREGLSLSYHNHNLEFLPIGDSNGWTILLNETDPKMVSFEVDIGWVAAGGLDPAKILESMTGRVRLVHVKDLIAPGKAGEALAMEPTEVGCGIVNWKSVVPVAYQAGARRFYVEQEPPYHIGRFEAAAKSYAYLVGI